MAALVIRKSTISELEGQPNIHELLDEYAGECAIDGLPHPSAKVQIYKQLEATGATHLLGAFLDNVLVGFIIVLSSVLPHYSTQVSTTESFFVTKAHRKTGAGIKLLREAERHVKHVGSAGLLVSAPMGGTLAEVLSKGKYRETNRVFFKRIGQ